MEEKDLRSEYKGLSREEDLLSDLEKLSEDKGYSMFLEGIGQWGDDMRCTVRFSRRSGHFEWVKD